jgi:hypothetical protein
VIEKDRLKVGVIHRRLTSEEAMEATMYRSMFFILSQIVMLESSVAIAHAQANQPPAIHRATSSQKASVMKISIEIDGRVVTGTLDDSAAANDFASLLPLMLSMKDYASTEKISDLPRRLSPQGAPAGLDPSVGDITYYAPWGNLAIFYGDADYARGLIKLGKIDSGIEFLNRSGSFDAKINLIKSSP